MSDFTDFFKNNIIKLYKLVLRRIMQAVLTIIHMAQYSYSLQPFDRVSNEKFIRPQLLSKMTVRV